MYIYIYIYIYMTVLIISIIILSPTHLLLYSPDYFFIHLLKKASRQEAASMACVGGIPITEEPGQRLLTR